MVLEGARMVYSTDGSTYLVCYLFQKPWVGDILDKDIQNALLALCLIKRATPCADASASVLNHWSVRKVSP